MAGMIVTMLIGNSTTRRAVDDSAHEAAISQMASDFRGLDPRHADRAARHAAWVASAI
jgi:hypothetical protein